MLKQFQNIIKIMRPRQWLKNIFIFAALVFDLQLLQINSLLTTIAAFILFCIASSLVYIINDLADIKADRLHPKKKQRPLASGELTQTTAIITAAVLALISFPCAFILNVYFGLIILAYFILMLAYSLWLKHVPLVDVMIIAIGFVLRVAAGVAIIQPELFSPWLILATTFLALFIGLGKRRAEIDLLEAEAGTHRQVLAGYSLELLDQLLTIVLSATLMTYCLYTISFPIPKDSQTMMLTIPFVIYGLFRYLYLIKMDHIGGAPEEVVLKDRPMQASILLWGITVILILYFF
jgi:4-hydroxybenzoate polyprenyltransferase